MVDVRNTTGRDWFKVILNELYAVQHDKWQMISNGPLNTSGHEIMVLNIFSMGNTVLFYILKWMSEIQFTVIIDLVTVY